MEIDSNLALNDDIHNSVYPFLLIANKKYMYYSLVLFMNHIVIFSRLLYNCID